MASTTRLKVKDSQTRAGAPTAVAPGCAYDVLRRRPDLPGFPEGHRSSPGTAAPLHAFQLLTPLLRFLSRCSSRTSLDDKVVAQVEAMDMSVRVHALGDTARTPTSLAVTALLDDHLPCVAALNFGKHFIPKSKLPCKLRRDHFASTRA